MADPQSDSTLEGERHGGGLPARLPSAGLSRSVKHSWSLLPPMVPLPNALALGVFVLGMVAIVGQHETDLPVAALGVALIAIVVVVAGLGFWWPRANQRGGWRSITVGDEGFWQKRLVMGDRFVAYDRVVGIEERQADKLALVRLRWWQRRIPRNPRPEDMEEIATLYRCRVRLVRGLGISLCSPAPGLASALEVPWRYYQSLEPPPELAELAPPSGDFAAWQTELRGLLDKTQSYRGSSVSMDQLFDIAEHPKASGVQRVAAALALSKAGRDERDRLERVVSNVAHPAVAEAMAVALKGRLDQATFAKAASAQSASPALA